MKDCWLFFENGVSKEWCNNLVEYVTSNYPSQDSTIGFKNNLSYDTNIRKSELRWLDKYKEKEVVDTLWKFAERANRDSFGVDITCLYDMQFTTYYGNSETPGKYDHHIDVDWVSELAVHRKLSIVIQLSDPKDYEGGVFEFDPLLPQLPEATKEQGTVIVFPSFHYHQVTPVTSGTRHSLVSWVEGPRWR